MYVEVIQKFEKAGEIDPNHMENYLYWGSSLSELSHYEDAIEKFKYTLEIKPDNPQIHKRLDDCYLR